MSVVTLLALRVLSSSVLKNRSCAYETKVTSPAAGATSGSHFEIVGARVPYPTVTPAFRARAKSALIAGTMFLTHLGWDVQVGSTMSNTSNAVLTGFSVTGTGSGIGGICSVSIGLAAPFPGGAGTALCAVADPAYVANAREVTRARVNELIEDAPVFWIGILSHPFRVEIYRRRAEPVNHSLS